MRRALIIQLARLGDLVQSLPAIEALRARHPDAVFDLLCAAPLADAGRLLPGIARVLPWDGSVWRGYAREGGESLSPRGLAELERHLDSLAPEPYDCAYVLNNHPRAMLAGSLLARDLRAPLRDGALGTTLVPWAAYVRDVAGRRRDQRVHLADAFCGLCGVVPPGRAPLITPPVIELPADLAGIGQQGAPWIGIIVGAGDAERVIPPAVLAQWVGAFLRDTPRGRAVLIGTDRQAADSIQAGLSSSLVGRVWDTTGRTSLPQLAAVLARCHRVLGPDTGPLHLAAALGTPVFGWYFARARVHETGPYGERHVIWQAEPDPRRDEGHGVTPGTWPVEDTLAALLERDRTVDERWTRWSSHCDRWGAYYCEAGSPTVPPRERETLWRDMHPVLS